MGRVYIQLGELSKMMKKYYFIIAAIFFSSCFQIGGQQRHYMAILDGYGKLPAARSLQQKFGGWSFIVHWNFPNDPKYGLQKHEKKWQTVTFLHGRYKATYVERVLLEKNGGLIRESLGGAELYLVEISNIFGDPKAPSGRCSDFQITIKGEQLAELVKSNWDFDSVGIHLKKTSPLENISWQYDYWNRIHPLQKVSFP